MAKPQTRPNARSAAAAVLTDVVMHQRSLNSALPKQLDSLDDRDRGFCQQLSYGTLRWYPSLHFLASQLLTKPLKNKDRDIFHLLMIGLYQLRDLRTPSHAAISETVNATKQLGKSWATGLLNACLRNYQRQQAELDLSLKNSEAAEYAHPDWLLKQYQADWPEQWEQICQANNRQPPMMLRVNQQHYSRDAYLKLLTEADIKAEPIADTEQGILLAQPCDVAKLPKFSDGAVSVQDGSAQISTRILNIGPSQHILDACAAPGGKTGHILETAPTNSLLALDISAERLEQVEANLARLQLKAMVKAADAADTQSWWDGELFDRILLDAPCTGSGVIRRHPDIKVLRREDDIASLATQQQQLLDALWLLLKPDGLMVYTTCSAFKQENEQQIEAFLQRHPDAEEVRPERPPAQPRPFGYQRLPGDDVMDGFFYACLRRN